jgi:hypothetical protein
MSADPALTTQRLVVVTGKGGVGKTAVTAALARAAVDAGRRVLAVEVGRARLGPLLGAAEPLGTDPTRLAPGLSAAAIDPEEALGDFFHGVLRLRLFASRLLESTSFQVLAAAAPGLAEFLVLYKISGWLDAPGSVGAVRPRRRRCWPRGHSLPPPGRAANARRARARSRPGRRDAGHGSTAASTTPQRRTLVAVVTTPEEAACARRSSCTRSSAGGSGSRSRRRS